MKINIKKISLISGLIFFGVLLGHYKPAFIFSLAYKVKPFLTLLKKSSSYERSVSLLSAKYRGKVCDSGNLEGGYSFFVAGHVYGKPRPSYLGEKSYPKFNGIYHLFKSNSKIKNCGFVPFGFLLGDVVNKASNHEFNILKADLKSFGSKMKIYIAPGNHDVGEGMYSSKRDIYVTHFGKTFSYFKYNNDLFILLDTNISGNWNIIGEQLEMLKNLKDNEDLYDNVFVFAHHIWLDSNNEKFSDLIANSNHPEGGGSNFWKEVFPIISNTGEHTFVFAGDVGAFDNGSEFFYENISGVDFFATGMGGGKRDNFLFLHIDDSGVNVELIPLNAS